MSSSEESYRVEPFVDHHHREGFTCGVDELDRYFYTQANQDRRRSLAVPYVMVDIASGAVIGYYTLSSLSILPRDLGAEEARRLPRYPAYPAILIGRLAIHRNHQGRGYGGALLLNALRRCHELSRQIGIMAVVVDAKDDKARSFYESFLFIRFQDEPYRLYIPMNEIARLY